MILFARHLDNYKCYEILKPPLERALLITHNMWILEVYHMVAMLSE